MAREAVAKTNFNSGELSPRVFGRTDVDKFYNGVARMQNWLPLPFGGAQRTPGTMFAAEVRDSAKPARIMDWVFGARQAYTILFNDSKIRFFKDRGQVFGASPISVTGITNANPGVVTAPLHGLSNGDHVILNGIDGMTEVNGVEYIVANKTANTFELTHKDTGANINTTSFGTFIANSATVLLLHLNTNFEDSSATGHTVTANGGISISTTTYKFGGGAIVFDGSDDYLSIPDHANFDFAADFCIDLQLQFDTLGIGHGIIHRDNGGGNGWQLAWSSASGGILFFSAGGGTLISRSWTPVVGQKYHVAIYRSGSNMCLTVDGVRLGAIESNSTNLTYTSALEIGVGDSGRYFNGMIDEVRITKGNARFSTAGFTPPTQESPIDDGTTVQGIYEITHPYGDDEIFDIQTAQKQDVMYLAHGDVFPQKLSRFDDDDWTIADVEFKDGPYLDENTEATTLDPDGTSGNVTITASSTTGINDGDGFLSTDVGRLIRYHDGTDWFWMTITAVNSTTEVEADIEYEAGDPTDTTMTGHAATARWRLGAWSETTGYPRAVAFFGGALWWAGTRYQPNVAWRSVVFELENMDEGAADAADALDVPCNSDNGTNIIQWLAAGKRLVAGTEGENFTIWSGSTTSTAITPENVKADPETNYGSSGVRPVKIGSYLYYVQDDDVTLREFYYDFGIDSFRSVNKSILSEHITRGLIKQIAYQKAPFGIVYCVLEDGKLATFTREIEQEVNGWADQTPRSGDTYESVAAIPVSEGYTEVWFVVSREINGETKQYVEYQVNPLQDVNEDLEDMVLMQSALKFMGAATVISGLEHLAGESVQVMVDGLQVTGKSVAADGTLTLDEASERVVIVGLSNRSQIKLLPLEAGSQIGSSQGMMKKTGPVMVRVYNSLGLTVGEDGGDMEELFRDGNGDLLTTLQTGDFEVPSTLGWDDRQQILFENDTPYPSTLLMAVLNEYTAEENVGK